MLNNKTIAVVVPAYNEEIQIKKVINTMPCFVDRIVVVDDCSSDHTVDVVKALILQDGTQPPLLNNHMDAVIPTQYNKAELLVNQLQKDELYKYNPFEIWNSSQNTDRIILIKHTKQIVPKANVGAAIASGYRWCRDNNIDCTAVMAGDGQMDPAELEKICLPVVNGEVDYVKANRLSHRSALFVIPKVRFIGNSILSLLTKIASGYWHISDSQTGYTAISLSALNAIRIYDIYPSYGCPNDILVKLNIAFCSIKEVPSKPVYNIGEKSKMRELKVIPRISWLLFKAFWKRLYFKYLFRDFHPLFLLYHFSFLLLLIDIPFAIKVLISIGPELLPLQTLLIFMFLTISGFQSLFFAMWMDMIDNERLQKL